MHLKRLTKIEKPESLKNAQKDKNKIVADFVFLSLFMDGNGKCKVPFTPPSRLHWLKQNSIYNPVKCLETGDLSCILNIKPGYILPLSVKWFA
jgi:hypothetical protein